MEMRDAEENSLERSERDKALEELRDALATVKRLSAELASLRECEWNAQKRHEDAGVAHAKALSELDHRAVEWEAVFNGVPISIVVYDDNGKVLESNSHRKREWHEDGIPADLLDDDACNKAYRMYYPDGRELPADQTASGLALKERVYVKNMLYHTVAPNGRVRHRMVSAVPLMNEARRVMVISQDVTDLDEARLEARRHSMELERLARQWKTVLQNLSDAVYVRDETDLLVLVNDAGLRLAGVESIGDFRPLSLFSPDGLPIPAEQCPTERARRGEVFQNVPILFRNARGKDGEALVSGGPIETPLGRVAFTVWHDITEQRRLERVKDDFLQVVAHEIKNPLQVMKGVVQVARLRQSLDDRTVKHLNILETQIDLTNSILADLLNATRVTHSSFSLKMDAVSLESILEDSLTPFAINPSGRNLHVVTHESLGAVLHADRRRLIEVLTNLISNAIKYTQHDGNIWVHSHAGKGFVTITVADDGIGIAEDELEKVFQGFYRSKRLSDWGATGLGLGLYISRSIARKHGGDLHAEKRLGGGAVMVLRLPLSDAALRTPEDYLSKDGFESGCTWPNTKPIGAHLLARIAQIRDELTELIEEGKCLSDKDVAGRVQEIDHLSMACLQDDNARDKE